MLNINKDRLIEEAIEILEDQEITGKEKARKMGMNVQQFYNYRSGHRDIKKAQLETLLKFHELHKLISKTEL